MKCPKCGNELTKTGEGRYRCGACGAKFHKKKHKEATPSAEKERVIFPPVQAQEEPAVSERESDFSSQEAAESTAPFASPEANDYPAPSEEPADVDIPTTQEAPEEMDYPARDEETAETYATAPSEEPSDMDIPSPTESLTDIEPPLPTEEPVPQEDYAAQEPEEPQESEESQEPEESQEETIPQEIDEPQEDPAPQEDGLAGEECTEPFVDEREPAPQEAFFYGEESAERETPSTQDVFFPEEPVAPKTEDVFFFGDDSSEKAGEARAQEETFVGEEIESPQEECFVGEEIPPEEEYYVGEEITEPTQYFVGEEITDSQETYFVGEEITEPQAESCVGEEISPTQEVYFIGEEIESSQDACFMGEELQTPQEEPLPQEEYIPQEFDAPQEEPAPQEDAFASETLAEPFVDEGEAEPQVSEPQVAEQESLPSETEEPVDSTVETEEMPPISSSEEVEAQSEEVTTPVPEALAEAEEISYPSEEEQAEKTVPVKKEAKYVYFGSYPQTEVKDSSVTATLRSAVGLFPTSENSHNWTSYRFLYGNRIEDFMWYIDLIQGKEKYRGVYFNKWRPSATNFPADEAHTLQKDNGYRPGGLYWFRYEPIRWRVLEEVGGADLLVADGVLDAREFGSAAFIRENEGDVNVPLTNYVKSSVRAFLNEDFYDTAFSGAERRMIMTTHVKNGEQSAVSKGEKASPKLAKYLSEDTRDKVFLLSVKEMESEAWDYRDDADPENYRLKCTDYTKVLGISASAVKTWLRSPVAKEDTVRASGTYGRADEPTPVSQTSVGVMPAIKIKETEE